MKKTPRYIVLTKGAIAIVDWDDYDWLNQYKWHLGSDGYARRKKRVDEVWSSKAVVMHRQIMDGATPIDHINRNILDNRRSNLRVCTPAENLWNIGKQRDSAQRFKGVSYPGNTVKLVSRPYQARLQANGRRYHGGLYATAEEAARAYDELARKHHGPFAVLNFPEVP